MGQAQSTGEEVDVLSEEKGMGAIMTAEGSRRRTVTPSNRFVFCTEVLYRF